nr:hypothetical protein [Tanacetum cinerariifolium]
MAGQAPPQGPIPGLRSMEELLQAPTDGVGDAIVVPSILANQFELKIEALTIIENKSKVQTSRNKTQVSSASGSSAQNAHVTALTKQVEALFSFMYRSVNSIQNGCETCGSLHAYYECQAVVATLKRTYMLHEPITMVKILINPKRPQGALASNTTSNPRADIKAITTLSGIVLDGPLVSPHTPFSSSKEVERDSEMIMDQVPTESTIRVPPLVIQSPPALYSSEIPHPPTPSSYFELSKSNLHQPPIPNPSNLLFYKKKLLGLADTSMTENCSAILLKKVPKKLKDPRKFLIPCDFQRLESCMALADLATRSIAYLAGIAENVCVQVGKFTFPADFIVVDYDVDPSVPLILRRPFLRTACALVDVHGEELILRDGDEKLIFHADSTSKHPHKHGNESINMINFIDITCEDRFPKTSDSLLDEFADKLALLDPFPSGNEDDNFDPEADLRKIKYLLNQDPSTESSPKYDIEIIDPILERFIDEPALVYSPPLGDDDDYLFYFKSDNDEWKKLFDPTLPEESSGIATLSSSPFENKDKVFNPDILILGRTQVFNDESKDKDSKVNTSTEALLSLEECNFLFVSSDQELLSHLELFVTKTLLLFSSENKDKVFNPEILTSKGVNSFTLGLSHRTYKTFKIINVHSNFLNEGPMKIFPFFCFCPKDKGIRGESS